MLSVVVSAHLTPLLFLAPLTTQPQKTTTKLKKPKVSGKFIDEFKMACAPEAKEALKHMMGHVHSSVTAACK